MDPARRVETLPFLEVKAWIFEDRCDPQQRMKIVVGVSIFCRMTDFGAQKSDFVFHLEPNKWKGS